MTSIEKLISYCEHYEVNFWYACTIVYEYMFEDNFDEDEAIERVLEEIVAGEIQ